MIPEVVSDVQRKMVDGGYMMFGMILLCIYVSSGGYAASLHVNGGGMIDALCE